jgi:hypothetical protein
MRDPDFFLLKYAPVTTKFTVLRTGLDRVYNFWIEWHRRNWEVNGFKLEIQHFEGALSNKLDAMLPLDNKQILLTETKDGRLAIFENSSVGSGSTDANYLANSFKLEKINFTFVHDGMAGKLKRIGSTQFYWVDYDSEVVNGWRYTRSRYIAAHKESRWEWDEHGTPFPWEETEAYSAKRIKDRLTPEMVERYAKHMGIDLFDPDYYSGRGVIVRLGPPPAADDPAMALISHYPNQ